MRNYPINQVYIYKAYRPFTEIAVRAYESYNYIEGGIVHNTRSKGEIIYRYAKTYGDVTALLLTRDNNMNRVERFLDKIDYPMDSGTEPLDIKVKYV